MAVDIEALYEQHRLQMIGFVRKRLRDDDQADLDDIVNEVFLKALKAAHQYRDRGLPPIFWLHQIARTLMIDRHRSKGRSKRGLEVPLIECDRAGLDAGSSRHDDMLLARSILDTLRSECPKQARVLELRFLHDMEHREVSDLLGISLEGVHKLQARGLVRARRIAMGDLTRFGALMLFEERRCVCGLVFKARMGRIYCSDGCKKRTYEQRRRYVA